MTQATGKRRGRPKFVPNAEQRHVVSTLQREGYTLGVIAKTVGVSVPTLQRAFHLELIAFHPKMLSNMLLKSYEKALKGHAPSIRLWLKRYPQFQSQTQPAPRAPKAPRPPRVGTQAWHEQNVAREVQRTGKLAIKLDMSYGIGAEVQDRIIQIERQRVEAVRRAEWDARRKAFDEEDQAANLTDTPSE